MKNAKISISGQRMAVRTIIMYASWTLETSVVSRVTREEVENLSMFSKEKVCMLSNISCRRFRAKPQEAVEQAEPARAPKVSARPAMRISARPYRRITPISQPALISLTSRAITKGIMHSRITSPVTKTGARIEGLLNSLILFISTLIIF